VPPGEQGGHLRAVARTLCACTLLTAVGGGLVGRAEAGGPSPTAGKATPARVLTVPVARALCHDSPRKKFHVVVRGYLVSSHRIPGTVEVIAALFARPVPRSTADVLPWPPPGGLFTQWLAASRLQWVYPRLQVAPGQRHPALCWSGRS
jgi:hypothetical protein